MQTALSLIKRKSRSLLPSTAEMEASGKILVVERWGPFTHIVFDIFHADYDSETAHHLGQLQNELPVIYTWLSDGETVQNATKGIAHKVNEGVRQMHGDHTAGVQPPFFVDHSDGKVPLFWNPRRHTHPPEGPAISL